MVSFVPWGVALALTLGTVACSTLAAWLRPGARVGVALGGWLVVVLAFVAGTRAAHALVVDSVENNGVTRLVDVVITPAVSNPFCHDVLVVETEQPLYRVRAATVAAFPALLPVGRCGAEPRGSSPAMWRSARVGTAGVRWDYEWGAPIADLVALQRGNCLVAAALRFVRVPFWYQVSPDSLLFGDLRYDRGDGDGFAEMRVPLQPPSCPNSIPPWEPPRHDILRGE
jgi:hypothetical protein